MENEAEVVPSLPTGCTHVCLREEEVKVPLVVQLYSHSQEVFYDFCTKRKETPWCAFKMFQCSVCGPLNTFLPFSIQLGSVSSSFYPDGWHNNCISPPNSPLATFCRVCLSEVGCHFGSEIKIAELRTLVGSNWDHDESKGTLGYGRCVPCARVIAQLGLTLLYVLRERSHGPKGREGDRMGTSAAGT